MAVSHAAPRGCVNRSVADTPPFHNGGTYELCTIDTARFPDARCNDGSPGMFQWQPSRNTASTTWVIWLAGGFDCSTAALCAARATDPRTQPLTTSIGAVPRAGHGLLSHDPALNPTLAGANTVLVRYCSSDAWSGGYRAPNGPAGFVATDPRTWNFEGRAIAKAAVASLMSLGIGFDRASRVLLGGSSAGGFGVTVTANDLLPLLPTGAQVLLANDAGFTLDFGRFDLGQPAPFVKPGPDTPLYRLLNDGDHLWHGRGDFRCTANAETQRQRVACYETAPLLQGGYVTLPTFVAESQLDAPELLAQICPSKDGKCLLPHDPQSSHGKYARAYGEAMARLLSAHGAASRPYTAFSPDAYVHTMLDNDLAFTRSFAFGTSTLSARDTFAAWYADPTSPSRVELGTAPGVR